MSDKVISASEVAEYVFCRRAWWLNRVAGYESENVRGLEKGSAYHTAHGNLVSRSLFARRLSYALVFLAVAVFVFLLVSGY